MKKYIKMRGRRCYAGFAAIAVLAVGATGAFAANVQVSDLEITNPNKEDSVVTGGTTDVSYYLNGEGCGGSSPTLTALVTPSIPAELLDQGGSGADFSVTANSVTVGCGTGNKGTVTYAAGDSMWLGSTGQLRVRVDVAAGSHNTEPAKFWLNVRDGSKPTITPVVDPPAPNGENGWYRSGDITVKFTVSDLNTPITARSSTCSTNDTTTTFTTDRSAHEVTCQATSSGGTDSRTVTVKRDVTAPTVGISSPVNNTTTNDASLTVSGTASDVTSGLNASSFSLTVGTVDQGAALVNGAFSKSVDLACGSNVITATVKDMAGNSQSAQVTVTRTCDSYIPTFLSPLEANGVENSFKNGRVIPVKVRIGLGGVNQGEAQLGGGRVKIAIVSRTCGASGADTDPVATFASAGEANSGKEFRWDGADGHWIYNLDTRSAALVAGQCYRVNVTVDGTTITTSTFVILAPKR